VAQSSTRVSSLMRSIADSQWMRNPELEVVQTKNDAIGSSFVLDAEQISVVNGDDTATKPRGPVRASSGSAVK